MSGARAGTTGPEGQVAPVDAGVRTGRVAWLAALVLAVLAPLVLMALGPSLPGRTVARNVGSALGFAVFVIFGLQVLLPARTRLGRPIGLDVLLRLHKHFGLIAVVLVIGHVVVIMADDPTKLRLLDVRRSPVRAKAAVVATIALLVLTATSLWRKRTGMRYERWRALHGVFAMAIVVLGFVHIVGVGKFSRSLPLLMLSLAVVGVSGGAYAHLRAGRPLVAGRRSFRVHAVRPEAGGATTLELVAEGPAPAFRPGQFAWLKPADAPLGLVEHPFSYASSAADSGRVSFTIKQVGDFTGSVALLEPGTTLLVDGPHGSYEPGHPDGAFLLLAAGIGITPVMSLLRTARDVGDRRRFVVVYGSRRWEDITFRDELDRLESELDLAVHHVLSQPPPGWSGATGRIRHEVLAPLIARMPRPINAFVCGPPAMVDTCLRTFDQVGLAESEVHAERFTSV